jgi:hypothetical protein
MRLPTRVHGMLDYALGALLLALPFLLGLARGPESWLPWALGAGLVVNALLTDYELGMLKRLQLPAHLWVDGLAGVLLAVSPWLFGFDSRVWIPHVALGALVSASALITDTIPGYDRRRTS